jgi:hypothetical protein
MAHQTRFSVARAVPRGRSLNRVVSGSVDKNWLRSHRYGPTFFRLGTDAPVMADDPADSDSQGEDSQTEESSFRERVEEIREQRAEGEEGGPPEEMMGGPGGGMGGMGGNPMAQMMGGGPGAMGGGPGGGSDNEELTREVRQLRDEVHDIRRTLERIADAIEE